MSSEQEVNSNEVNSNEVEYQKSPIRMAISEPHCGLVNFVWNIGNFELLTDNWFKFQSSCLELQPSCCGLRFDIQRELAQKVTEDEQNSWTFTILTLPMYRKDLQEISIDEHLRKDHSVEYHNCNQYLMGPNGKKRFIESGSLANRKFVVQLRDDQLRGNSDYLNSGSLEFRVDLQLFTMVNSRKKIIIPRPLDQGEELAENFGDLFVNKILSDLTIQTEDGSFKAHKAILAARSPVFEKMFTIDMKEKEQNSVKIHGPDSRAMGVFLRYIYEDKLEFDDSAAIDLKLNILQLADQYQIPRLKGLCELELIKSFDADSIFRILVAADTHDAEYLRKNGLLFINLHKSTLAKHEDICPAIGNSIELGSDILKALTGN